jgi:predicted nucleic acid-binding protein
MSRFAFVDTSAWFAAVVPWDANHASSSAWFERNERPLMTTDYIVDETLTLLRSRGEGQRAIALGERFFKGQVATVHRLSSGEIEAAWEVFRMFRDKEWSFTDCTSKVVIEELACAVAVAFDEHFRQFGTVLVEP